jgi:hypothetical protein
MSLLQPERDEIWTHELARALSAPEAQPIYLLDCRLPMHLLSLVLLNNAPYNALVNLKNCKGETKPIPVPALWRDRPLELWLSGQSQLEAGTS